MIVYFSSLATRFRIVLRRNINPHHHHGKQCYRSREGPGNVWPRWKAKSGGKPGEMSSQFALQRTMYHCTEQVFALSWHFEGSTRNVNEDLLSCLQSCGIAVNVEKSPQRVVLTSVMLSGNFFKTSFCDCIYIRIVDFPLRYYMDKAWNVFSLKFSVFRF